MDTAAHGGPELAEVRRTRVTQKQSPWPKPKRTCLGEGPRKRRGSVQYRTQARAVLPQPTLSVQGWLAEFM